MKSANNCDNNNKINRAFKKAMYNFEHDYKTQQMLAPAGHHSEL